jgi:hypothetical protein
MLIAGFAIIVSAFYGIDSLINPWAYSYSGHPRLVGYWHGEVLFDRGDRRQIVLHLTNSSWAREGTTATGSRARRFNIAGAAKICGPRGNSRYQIGGFTHNRAGTRFTVGFTADSLAKGKHLNAPDATWDGEDRLELRTTVYAVGDDGVASATVSMDARAGSRHPNETIVFELRRTDEDAFDRAC